MTHPFPDDPAVEARDLLRFDRPGPDRFRSHPAPSGLLRLYGGQIVAQALTAMRETVPPDKVAHALHLFYQRPGLTDRPLDFAVERDTDGRSFAQRRVAVTQDGAPVAHAMASFQVTEDSALHQDAMPRVPGPETLEPLARFFTERFAEVPERQRPFWCRRQMFDWRPVEPFHLGPIEPRPARRHFWLRAQVPFPDSPEVHQTLLAYASDTHIIQGGLRPMGIAWDDPCLQISSLDHAIWFHQSCRVDDWLLYVVDCPVASGARVLGTGTLFRRDGALVATVVQQGLARMLDAPRIGKI
ncbi:acyl-CoA thioesterase II [Novosphingobium aerophilum]|uniref:acyl-CoA thioesterase n=1 Tax=Novosphingobium aerophilum TaxID=2839843 RepID=UPI002E2990DD|nr:acyl-CoA thioesterase II [Novosphingobium aerophilum]